MSLETLSWTEPITEPDILADIAALPTEDDLPSDDGEPMETPRHRDQMISLIYSLQTHWADRTNYYVSGNMFLYYDPQSHRKFRGPDFFLVLDVNNRERKSWVVWQEGMRFPDIIIELLSDTTREVDTGEKKTLYERVFHTSEYYLYDPLSHDFVGYHLQSGRYQPVEPDEQGRVYSPQADLYLVVRDEWLRWMTPAGVILPTPEELAKQERQRAEQAEHHAAQTEQRAEHAEQRAEQERQRAEQAEQLLERYRQRFGNVE